MSTVTNDVPADIAIPPKPETVSWGGPMPAPDGVWRLRTSDTMPEGGVWFSDGNKVWFAFTNGTPGAYSAATACKFWTPAQVPAPPSLDEIARLGAGA